MNNFDWIVTVAIGSIFASTIVLDDTTILEGALAISFLLALQYVVTLSVRKWSFVRNLIKATPQLLFYDGEFMEETMEKQRIIRAEVFAAMRERGYQNIDNIYAVVLETNAALSIIGRDDNAKQKPFSLSDVQGLPDGLKKKLKEEGAATKEDSKERSGEDDQREQISDANAHDKEDQFVNNQEVSNA